MGRSKKRKAQKERKIQKEREEHYAKMYYRRNTVLFLEEYLGIKLKWYQKILINIATRKLKGNAGVNTDE